MRFLKNINNAWIAEARDGMARLRSAQISPVWGVPLQLRWRKKEGTRTLFRGLGPGGVFRFFFFPVRSCLFVFECFLCLCVLLPVRLVMVALGIYIISICVGVHALGHVKADSCAPTPEI